MWYIVGAVVFIVVAAVLFLKSRNRREPDLVSIVILRTSPAGLSDASIRAAHRRAYGSEPRIERMPRGPGMVGIALIAPDAPPITVLDSAEAYMSEEEAAETASRAEHPELRRAILEHRSWVSLDAMGIDARRASKEAMSKVHAYLGRLAAEFIDGNSTLLFRPFDNRVGRAGEAEARLLSAGRCDEAFGDADLHAPVTQTRADDPAINGAMQEAARRLPEFVANWKAASSRGPTMIKGRFPAGEGGHEYIWCSVVEETGSGFKGKIENNPVAPGIPPKGTVVEVPLERIVDWAYLSEKNEPVGLFVDRLLMKMNK
jgi:uncharacterized protein YegJ (DUF2314 family)